MMFTVPDLKGLSAEVQELNAKESRAMSAMLHRRQPEFCEMIAWVGMDARCARAHWFCTMFCALACRQAEMTHGRSLPGFAQTDIQDIAGFIARGEEAEIGKRACGYPKRILRHVLSDKGFDDEDSEWLSTTISAFLFMAERALSRRGAVVPD
jgi:hypothetical protein